MWNKTYQRGKWRQQGSFGHAATRRYAGNVTFICSGTLQLNSPIGTHSVQMLVHSGAAPILQEHVGSMSQTYSLFKKLIDLRFDACEKSLCDRRTFIGQLHPFVSLLLWPAWRDRPQSLCCVWLEGEGRVCRLKAYYISLAGFIEWTVFCSKLGAVFRNVLWNQIWECFMIPLTRPVPVLLGHDGPSNGVIGKTGFVLPHHWGCGCGICFPTYPWGTIW